MDETQDNPENHPIVPQTRVPPDEDETLTSVPELPESDPIVPQTRVP